MVKTRPIQVRLTRYQHEQIRAAAEQRGFASVAAYLRYVALDHNRVIEEKLLEIHRHLLDDKNSGKRRSKGA